MKKLFILLVMAMFIAPTVYSSENPFAPNKCKRKKCKVVRKSSKRHLKKTYPFAGCYHKTVKRKPHKHKDFCSTKRR